MMEQVATSILVTFHQQSERDGHVLQDPNKLFRSHNTNSLALRSCSSRCWLIKLAPGMILIPFLFRDFFWSFDEYCRLFVICGRCLSLRVPPSSRKVSLFLISLGFLESCWQDDIEFGAVLFLRELEGMLAEGG